MRANKKEYAAIADRAVEVLGALEPTRWEEAYNAIKSETVTRQKSEVRYNEIDILRELGMVTGGEILDKLEAALPARVVRAIQGEGIDLAHTETQAVLTSLVPSVLTQAEHDMLIALVAETVPVFSNLRPGEVQNALEWRYQGVI